MIADEQAIGTIIDNDATPTLTIDDANANENEADGTMKWVQSQKVTSLW